MANTHRAVVETSAPPSLLLVGSGPREFCEEALDRWIQAHPLGEFDEALVLATRRIGTPTLPDQ